MILFFRGGGGRWSFHSLSRTVSPFLFSSLSISIFFLFSSFFFFTFSLSLSRGGGGWSFHSLSRTLSPFLSSSFRLSIFFLFCSCFSHCSETSNQWRESGRIWKCYKVDVLTTNLCFHSSEGPWERVSFIAFGARTKRTLLAFPLSPFSQYCSAYWLKMSCFFPAFRWMIKATPEDNIDFIWQREGKSDKVEGKKK